MTKFIYYRGSSWFEEAVYVRATNRIGYEPSFRNNYLGFRIVRSYE